ncbi:hypothetical protein O0L34_g17071 [Tuta absoluta]|nr:hypothetical protein O0L34_g17071 [Tuta absoluta]
MGKHNHPPPPLYRDANGKLFKKNLNNTKKKKHKQHIIENDADCFEFSSSFLFKHYFTSTKLVNKNFTYYRTSNKRVWCCSETPQQCKVVLLVSDAGEVMKQLEEHNHGPPSHTDCVVRLSPLFYDDYYDYE